MHIQLMKHDIVNMLNILRKNNVLKSLDFNLKIEIHYSIIM